MPPPPLEVPFDEPWTEAELQAFVAAALDAGLGSRSRREILLLHVPRALRDQMPVHERPDLQLISDLRILAEQPEGFFEQWQENAAELVPERFAEVLMGIDSRPDPYPPPPKRSAGKRRRRRPKALFLLALVFLLGAIGFVGWTLLEGDPAPDAGRRAPASTAPKTTPPR